MQFCIFETALGTGGIAWTSRGVAGVQLPEPDAERVRGRLARRWPGAIEASPTQAVDAAIEGMVGLLRGEPRDLGFVVLDDARVPAFAREVYAVARTIQPGQTMSYGQIAARLGDPHQAREVGQALARNPFPIVVPCHRVLASGGQLGGFSAAGGVLTKQRLLSIERADASWQMPLGLGT